MTNFGKWLSRFLLAGLTDASVSGCVQQDDKKEESPAPPPAATPPEPARSAVAIDAKAPTRSPPPAGSASSSAAAARPITAQAEIAACNGSPAQQFKMQAIPGDYYTVVKRRQRQVPRRRRLRDG